jgi:hypothetical protein
MGSESDFLLGSIVSLEVEFALFRTSGLFEGNWTVALDLTLLLVSNLLEDLAI